MCLSGRCLRESQRDQRQAPTARAPGWYQQEMFDPARVTQNESRTGSRRLRVRRAQVEVQPARPGGRWDIYYVQYIELFCVLFCAILSLFCAICTHFEICCSEISENCYIYVEIVSYFMGYFYVQCWDMRTINCNSNNFWHYYEVFSLMRTIHVQCTCALYTFFTNCTYCSTNCSSYNFYAGNWSKLIKHCFNIINNSSKYTTILINCCNN